MESNGAVAPPPPAPPEESNNGALILAALGGPIVALLIVLVVVLLTRDSGADTPEASTEALASSAVVTGIQKSGFAWPFAPTPVFVSGMASFSVEEVGEIGTKSAVG